MFFLKDVGLKTIMRCSHNFLLISILHISYKFLVDPIRNFYLNDSSKNLVAKLFECILVIRMKENTVPNMFKEKKIFKQWIGKIFESK